MKYFVLTILVMLAVFCYDTHNWFYGWLLTVFLVCFGGLFDWIRKLPDN